MFRTGSAHMGVTFSGDTAPRFIVGQAIGFVNATAQLPVVGRTARHRVWRGAVWSVALCMLSSTEEAMTLPLKDLAKLNQIIARIQNGSLAQTMWTACSSSSGRTSHPVKSLPRNIEFRSALDALTGVWLSNRSRASSIHCGFFRSKQAPSGH